MARFLHSQRLASVTRLSTILLQRKCACGKIAAPAGECDECSKERLERNARNSELVARSYSSVPPMELRFGHDFSKVRVYSDAKAAESTRDMNTLAQTVARDRVMGLGQFAPSTTPEAPDVGKEPTPIEKPEAPTAGTEPTPMQNPPAQAQGPAITVANGWANPAGKTDRINVGIGEQSSFVVNDVAGGSWKSADGKGKTLDSVSFQWTASAAGKNKITYTAADKTTSDVTMTTEVPITLSGTKDSDITTYAKGTQGAGMNLTITVSPTTVSFQALELMEGTCNASAKSGYFSSSSHPPPAHDKAAGAGTWRQVGPKNDVSDTADSSDWPSPWSKGSYTWAIPVSWRLTGAKTSTAFSKTSDQVVTINGSDGETVVTKLGAKTDPRKP